MSAQVGAASAYARVVLDTNVLLSAALIPDGVPAQLTDWLLQHARLVFSAATLAEFEARVWKPKFDRYLSIEQRQRVLHDVQASAIWVEIPEAMQQQSWSRDPADDAFIRTALVGDVRRLITGDEDLLVLGLVENTRILTPRAALEEASLIYGRGS